MSTLLQTEGQKPAPKERSHRKSGANVLLWLLIALNTLLSLLQPWVPMASALGFIVIAFVFSLVHGSRRYGIRGILMFLVISFIVSNSMENSSILTGFPFGHYHYPGGMKLFQVPIAVGILYFSMGYICWTVGNVLLDQIDTRLDRWGNVIALPVVAAFVMVMWDVVMDPINSTILHIWIWHNGGGYFGVPLSNYLGWYLTVYLFFQLFTLYLARTRHSSPLTTPERQDPWYQAVLFYLLIGLGYLVTYLASATGSPVADATGWIWRTHDLYETAVIISISTMGFVSVLALIKLIGSSSRSRATNQ